MKSVVRPSFYRDSVELLRVAEALGMLPGVRQAAALMGTPANQALLAEAGLVTAETTRAGVNDLIISVDAESDAAALAALEAAEGLLAERRGASEGATMVLPCTLDSALSRLPDANLAVISVPGAYAKAEALRALRRGCHVFLFSGSVSLADEVELKELAVRQRLLLMGPDCGTAYLSGIGLGFANVVPRGRIGCVAASGTGLQAVASHLAALGEGISQGIGVGGRDLSAEVGGAMTSMALEALGADPETEVVVLISKPPAPGLMPGIEATLKALGKPVVACCLGMAQRADGVIGWAATLEDAAVAAAAVRRGRAWAPALFSDPAGIRARLARLPAAERRGGGLLGLFTGGTLAHEARLLLEPLIGPVASNLGEGGTHRIVDLGADEFTVGRPHPMLDPEARAARVREAGRSAAVSVLLLDLVLGRAAHPDPARPLAAAIREARSAAAADGRSLAVVASVLGTAGDPQGLSGQVAALEAVGVELLPSNAQAARFAALLTRPELAGSLLGSPR